MNKFSEQLLSAFEVAMDEKLSKLQYDKTIQAVINEVVDVDVGEYRVKYQDGIMSAYATDPAEVFKEGDLVYVTVPEGDFSNKKFISHKITNNSLSAGQYSQLTDMIIDVSTEFQNLGFVYNDIPSDSEGYRLEIGNDSEVTIAESQLSDRFAAYAEKYEYIKIAASFKTEFTQEHTSGDYGIKVVFKDKQGVDIPYYLHVNDFNGDPYRLYTWSPQETVIKIPKGQIASLSSILFFEKNFTSEGNAWNLFMKDLALTFVERVDMTDLPYYLNIIPVEGILFTPSITSISLVGQLIHYGDELPSSRCIYKWFERDLTIMPGVDGYDKRVGWGWKEIPNEVGNTLVRKNDQAHCDVPCEKSYKLLVVYNSDTIVTKEITLYSAKLNVEIEQVNQNGTIVLKLTDNAYVGDWFYLTADGYQEAISGATHVNATGDVSGYLISSPMIFYCSVYKNNIYQGELTYVMQSIESKDDVSVVFSGEDIFTYDANGDINIYDSEYEKSLSAEIIWKKGVISSACTIRWLDYAGNVISTTARDYSGDSNMMFSSVRVDETGKILYYKIKPWLREVPSKNNTFQIEIATADGQRYIFEKQIIFTKTGDPGTNGSNYTSYIKITSTNKNVRDNQTQAVQLTCYVYKGQALVSSGITVAWTLSNLTQVSVNNNVLNVKANGTNKKRYVKATITVKENNKIVATLYDFYPVDTATVANTSLDTSLLPKYIKYSASGRNPTFLRRALSEVKYNGNAATITPDDVVLTKVGDYLRPADEFDPTNSVGLLTITSGLVTFYHPVPTYINTFGNEAINGWDGVSVDVDNAGGKILAPQVGAGTKDSANKFTGVVMGRDSAQQKIGLYGYQAGETSFALMDNGSAFFGKAGTGRIWINKEGSDSATIEGGGGGTSTSGMTITLSAADSSADAIRVGKGNFIVTYGGKLTATGATISGNITATSGYIGGWQINSKSIYSKNTLYLHSGAENEWPATFKIPTTVTYWQYSYNSSTKVYTLSNAQLGDGTTVYTCANYFVWDNVKYFAFVLNGNNCCVKAADLSNDLIQSRYRLWSGAASPYSAKFSVTGLGAIRATDANLTGTITAKTGYIGWNSDSAKGWKIEANKISSNEGSGDGTKYVALSSNGTYAIWAGHTTNSSAPFSVTHNGKLKATSAEISGKITASEGSIGNWKINSNSDGALCSTLTDTNASTRIYLNGKPAAGKNVIEIKTSSQLDDDDKETAQTNGHFYVTDQGKLYAKNAEIHGTLKSKAGTIGSWNISSNAISTLASETSATNSGTTGMAKTGFKGYIKVGENTYATSDNANKISGIAFWSGMAYVKEGDAYYLTEKDSGTFFAVTHGGKLYCRSAEISGKVTADSGNIGGWAIKSRTRGKNTVSTLNAGNTYLDSDGYISCSSGYFSGDITTGNLDATGGTIGGWLIGENTLTGGDVILDSENGIISGATIRGSLFQDEDGISTLKLDKTEYERKLIFSPDPHFSGFEVVYEAAGDSTDATLSLNGKQLFYVNSRLTTVSPGYSGQTWNFENVKLGGFPYGSDPPNSSTRGYGVTGALYFKIS